MTPCWERAEEGGNRQVLQHDAVRKKMRGTGVGKREDTR